MDRITLTKEERTRAFLTWYDDMLTHNEWSSEQVARKGEFDSSLISKYRKGEKNVGPKVVERAARAFGLDDEDVLKLLQHLQLVPGGNDDTSKEDQKVAAGWAKQIARVDDDQERRRLISTADLLIKQSLDALKQRRGESGDRKSTPRGSVKSR